MDRTEKFAKACEIMARLEGELRKELGGRVFATAGAWNCRGGAEALKTYLRPACYTSPLSGAEFEAAIEAFLRNYLRAEVPSPEPQPARRYVPPESDQQAERQPRDYIIPEGALSMRAERQELDDARSLVDDPSYV